MFSSLEKLLKDNNVSGANVFAQIAAEGMRLENRISSKDTTPPNQPFAAPATQIAAQQPTNIAQSPTLAEQQAHVRVPSASPIDTILIGLNVIQDTHLRDPSLEGLVMSGSYTIEDMQKCVNAIQTPGIKERC